MNRLIDDVCHPLYQENEWIRLIDGAMHGVAEQNYNVSLRKFVKYNLPEIAKKIIEKLSSANS